MSSCSQLPSPRVEELLSTLVDDMLHLRTHLARVKSRLEKLEKSKPKTTAKPPPSTAPAYTKAKGRKPRKSKVDYVQPGGHIAPNSTPITGVPAHSIRSTNLTQAAQEKTTASLSISDDQAGHVVGRAGSGLKQVHDISGAKVSVSPTVTANCRLVTIRGTDREVGDALTAIGKRLARRRLRSPKKKAKKDKAPSSGNPITSAPPPPVVKIVPSTPKISTTPTPSTGPQPISRSPSQPPTPMALSTPTPIPTPFLPPGSPMAVEAHSDPGTPMDIGVVRSERERLEAMLLKVKELKRLEAAASTSQGFTPRGRGRGRG